MLSISRRLGTTIWSSLSWRVAVLLVVTAGALRSCSYETMRQAATANTNSVIAPMICQFFMEPFLELNRWFFYLPPRLHQRFGGQRFRLTQERKEPRPEPCPHQRADATCH